jgi:hypothetical protein
MPAKRALAALDQPALADTGPPKRISKKVRAAIDAMVCGDCKKIVEAAAKVGLARASLSRALSTPVPVEIKSGHIGGAARRELGGKESARPVRRGARTVHPSKERCMRAPL